MYVSKLLKRLLFGFGVFSMGVAEDTGGGFSGAAEADSDAVDSTASSDNDADSQPELDADNPDLETPEEEDEEIDVGGKKFALPKSAAATLKAERLMQADYTRKTQEVAATRTQIEARAAQVETQAREQQQYIGEIAKVQSIDAQLAEYNALDWQRLSDEDPAQCQKLDLQRRSLEAQRGTAVHAITQKQQQFALAEQQNTAKQAQEASDYFQREIPGWSRERDDQVTKFAVDNGIPAQALSPMVLKHPQLAKILHKAELYDQLEKKQIAKPKTPTQPPAPVPRIGASRATASKDPEKMSTAEWMRQRDAQVRKK